MVAYIDDNNKLPEIIVKDKSCIKIVKKVKNPRSNDKSCINLRQIISYDAWKDGRGSEKFNNTKIVNTTVSMYYNAYLIKIAYYGCWILSIS